jgi:hypothetical protein
LIKKNDVTPIISHPKNKFTKFPDKTKNTILITNKFKSTINLSTKGSYLKYENANKYANTAIVIVKKAKPNDILSINKSKFILLF